MSQSTTVRGNEAWRAWRFKDPALVLMSLIVVLLLWEGVARWSGLNPRVFVGPSAIWATLRADWASGALLQHLKASGANFAWGYFAAALAGVPMGLLLGASRTLDLAFSPYIVAMYSMPTQAWQPLLVMALGLGFYSQVTLIFLFAFFIIVMNTMAGVKSVDPVLLRVGRCFGASRRDVFFKIIMPSTLPYIISGLRLGVGRAIIGVFLSEFFGATAGLGFYIVRAGTVFQMDKVFAGLLLLVFISIVLTEGIRIAEERLTPWKPRR